MRKILFKLFFIFICLSCALVVWGGFIPLSKDYSRDQVSSEIFQAMKERKEWMMVSSYKMSDDDIKSIVLEQINEHPELFYADQRVRTLTFGRYAQFLNFDYMYTGAEIYRIQDEIRETIAEVASLGTDNTTGFEAVTICHDYLIKNVQYSKASVDTSVESDIANSTYGTLITRRGLCMGYARAMKLLLNEAFAVNCEVVMNSDLTHAWNMVEIDGKYYHVDVTWDDVLVDGRQKNKDDVCRLFFLLSDEELKTTERSLCEPEEWCHQAWVNTGIHCNSTYIGK